MTVTLNTTALDELNTREAKMLHELMGELRFCGINGIVNLPQIVVVGEQNAGKSSVLEAISGVRFPVAAGLCTRFATEISFYKTEYSRINVRIRRDITSGSEVDIAFDESGAGKEDLPELIQKAKERMGISDGDKDFSKDVLCISVEGPEMVPLTLVDLPGIFVNETATQSKGGIKTVNDLVDHYMAQPKSIMLVIVEANIDIARHGALARVGNHDPKHERTLGVVTKPDLAKGQGHVEAEHIRLAQNREPKHMLRLGWHVLRNRAENGESLSDRDAIETKFLESPPWDAVNKADRGIARLREKLSYILYNHTRSCLPVVIEDIEKHLKKRQEEKAELGTERLDHKDMRTFLLTIATEFQRLLREANSGHYVDKFFGQLTSPQNRLRAELKGFQRALDFVLRSRGHRFSITRAGEDQGESKEESDVDLAPIATATFLDTHPYQFSHPKKVSRSELKQELRVLATANEGRELPGTCNSELAIHLFKIQASPWRDIAQFHIRGVAKATKLFVEQLLHHVVGRNNADTTENMLLSDYVDDFFRKREELLDKKLDELLAPYIDGDSVPLEEEFEGLASQWRVERMVEQLQKLPLSDLAREVEEKQNTSKASFFLAATNIEDSPNGAFDTTERIIDMMQAYYKMSLRTFTENVTNLAIEGCLIHDLATIFTPVKVGEMSNERLEELASEPASAQSRRAQLTTEIVALQKSLDTCRRRMPRAEPRNLFTADASTNARGSLFWSAADSPAKQSTERLEISPTTPKSDATSPAVKSLQKQSPAVSRALFQATKSEGTSISQSPSKDAKGPFPALPISAGGFGNPDEGAVPESGEKKTSFAKLNGSGSFGSPGEGFSFGSSASNNKTGPGSPGRFEGRNL
ncbi:Dynamin, GTPase domain protein [Akanthomyces lecanii RCEF 1005]|uniref:Dynamin, GTPase domain protein n=1 Tax=Akanthomyces lecanii RCEF 1005 TaxID=1081108 RepID=A0A168J626_CORDF|nr:Dynamin, GTPase domain protein [Akanthomyces lecanii RCEF 1005]